MLERLLSIENSSTIKSEEKARRKADIKVKYIGFDIPD